MICNQKKLTVEKIPEEKGLELFKHRACKKGTVEM